MSAERMMIVNTLEYKPGRYGYELSREVIAGAVAQFERANGLTDPCRPSNGAVRDSSGGSGFFARLRAWFERARPWWVWP